jgi:hypothetical protein
VNNDPVNYTDPWGLSASDGGRDTEEDDSTYTAQTVQYRQDIVYYYEIQTISSPMAQLLPDIKYQTRYSYDSNAITADKNSLVSDLKDADFIQSSQNRRVFYYANTKTSEVVNIMIGETQQAPSLPQSLKSPKQGEVLRTPGRSTENGFSR